MKTKHLEDLYSWKQISKLQQVFLFNRHNDFVPIAIYAPNGGVSVQYSRDEHYEWSGKKTPYYAKRLWEEVRKELTSIEKDYLAFDIVSASECFNTIQFRNSEKVHKYCDEFMRLLKTFADDGKVKCAIGRAPARPYPWDTSQRYEEYIISDDAEFIPSFTLDLKFYNSVPEYSEEDSPKWSAVEKYFIKLTESELAFLNGENIINKTPTALDKELQEACKELDVPKVATLLKAGANPNSNSGNPFFEPIVSDVFFSAFDLDFSDIATQKMYEIINLLLEYGCDINLCHFESCTPMYDVIHCDNPQLLKYMIEKGADPNAPSWIGLDLDEPATPLDHIAIDDSCEGIDPKEDESFKLLRSHGGKFFSELVPDFL